MSLLEAVRLPSNTSPLILSLDLCSDNWRPVACFSNISSLVACALCCLIHSLRIELYSFLPNHQGYGGQLPRYRQHSHFRPSTLVNQLLVILLELFVGADRVHSSAFESMFQSSVKVLVQSASLRRLFALSELFSDPLIISARARNHCQPAVRPELSLCSKPMW